VSLSQGESLEAICRKLSITRQTYYRWRKIYGGMRIEQAKRLKDLERENGRLKQLVGGQRDPSRRLESLQGRPPWRSRRLKTNQGCTCFSCFR